MVFQQRSDFPILTSPVVILFEFLQELFYIVQSNTAQISNL